MAEKEGYQDMLEIVYFLLITLKAMKRTLADFLEITVMPISGQDRMTHIHRENDRQYRS